jgi:hypothetical protein
MSEHDVEGPREFEGQADPDLAHGQDLHEPEAASREPGYQEAAEELGSLIARDPDQALRAIGYDPAILSPEDREGMLAGIRSRRPVPIPRETLRPVLGWILATGRRDDDLIFGSTASSPFIPTSLQRRADRAWKAAGLERLTLHDCRHTYASFAIAAGVNAKALSTYMGHDPDHIRSLRPPYAGQRGAGGRAARRLPG